MVKLFAWEAKVKEQLGEKREAELQQIKRRSLWGTATGSVNWLLPIVTMVVCYGCYTSIEGQPLTAAKVFSVSQAARSDIQDTRNTEIPLLIRSR